MATTDQDAVAFIYKKCYSDDQVGDCAMREHVLLNMIAKKRGLGGEDFTYIIRSGNPQGVSGTFTDAQSGSSASKGKKFVTEDVTKYGVVRLSGQAMARAAARGKQAFYELVTMESDGIFEEMGDAHAFDLYGNGNGNRGQVASISNDTITLTDANDARNFKEGMTIITSANADGSAPDSGSTTIVAIDEDNGTITVDDASDITTISQSDYIFRKGDPGTCVDGLPLFLPLTAPGSGDDFRGANRSSNVRAYAGSRIDDTSQYLEHNLGLLGVKVSTGGKKAEIGLCNPLKFHEIVQRRDAKVQYTAPGEVARIGFEFITVTTSAGTIKLFPDADCPTNRAWIGSMKSFEIRYLKEKFIHLIRDDGRPSMRLTGEDSIEIRARSLSQTIHRQPAEWGVCSVG